jgi:hypothetical protein
MGALGYVRWLLGAVLLWAGCLPAWGGPWLTTNRVEVLASSPLQTYVVEQRTLATNEVMEIWLVPKKTPQKRQLLYAHERSVTVLFSDNEHWLALNDFAGSNIAEISLFQQQPDLKFKRIGNISDGAWDFFCQQNRLKTLPLDHSYAEVLRWTDDHTLLICLRGDGNHHRIDDWLCFYDLKNKTFSTDLNRHNQRHNTMEDGR